MTSYIKIYEGHWKNESGMQIHTLIESETTARVSLFINETLEPMTRPWFDNKVAVNLEAYYLPSESPELVIELWEAGSGFCFHLLHENNLVANGKYQDALIPSISRYEEDTFLDKYYSNFGPLHSFVKSEH